MLSLIVPLVIVVWVVALIVGALSLYWRAR
jgi:hypothetical protein